MTADAADLEATITVDATPAQVWAMVTDVARMSAWSPQVVKTIVLGGPVRLGTRFLNINHQGWKHWPTNARVVRFTPHRDFAFRIVENRTVWSYQLDEVDGGTRVTHRREVPDGISTLSRGLTAAAFGGQRRFAALLQEGMEQTLQRLKADAERHLAA